MASPVLFCCFDGLTMCLFTFQHRGKTQRLPSEFIISKNRTKKKKNSFKHQQTFTLPLSALLLACCCVQEGGKGHCCSALCPFVSKTVSGCYRKKVEKTSEGRQRLFFFPALRSRQNYFGRRAAVLIARYFDAAVTPVIKDDGAR